MLIVIIGQFEGKFAFIESSDKSADIFDVKILSKNLKPDLYEHLYLTSVTLIKYIFLVINYCIKHVDFSSGLIFKRDFKISIERKQ